MGMKNDPFSFETFRPNYELRAAVAWLAVSVLYAVYTGFDYFAAPSKIILYSCLLMFVYQAIPGYKRLKQTLRLAGEPLPLMEFSGLKKKMAAKVHREDIWIGRGFKWSKEEAQNLHQLLDRDWKNIQKEALGIIYYWRFFKKNKKLFFTNPLGFFSDYKETQKRVAENGGQPWIHGCGPEEDDLYLPISQTERHTFIIGSTGSGKTRCFDLFICQAILRGETVIVIDPKSDPDLQSKIKRACHELSRDQDFYNFNPAVPEESVKLNLLASWTQPTELASRIAQLMPQGGSSDSFTNFAWRVINAVSQAYCLALAKKPTIKSFLDFIEGDMPAVVCRVIETVIQKATSPKALEDWYAMQKAEVKESTEARAAALIKFYRSIVAVPDCAIGEEIREAVNGIIGQFEHDREHFGKMITSLIPTLSMLTSGRVGALLSPPDEDSPEARNASKDEHHKSIASLIKTNAVLYIGLNSLADSKVGNAIGALAIADITSTAGMIYAYEKNEANRKSEGEDYSVLDERIEQTDVHGHYRVTGPNTKPINIFIDEAAEVTSNPLVQLLNKGRGAGIKAFIATQTIADFAKVMGSKDAATMILGNLNNFICLQIQDAETAKYFAEKFPKTKVSTIIHGQSQNVGADSIAASGASLSQRREEKEEDLVPQTILSQLPPLEFFALLAGGNVVKGRFPLLVTDRVRFDRFRWLNRKDKA